MTTRTVAESDLQLLESLETLERVYQSAPIGLCVLDRQMRYVRINEFLARLNGLTVEEHLGRTVREVIPEAADHIEPILRRVIETGQPEPHQEGPAVDRSRPGGTWLWRAAWRPLFDTGGRVAGVSVTVEDITEQRRSEEAYRSLAENAPALVARFDRNLRHLFVNAAGLRVRDLKPEQIIGKTMREAGVPDPYCATWEERLRRIFATGEALDLVDAFPTSDGIAYFHGSAVPEPDETGAVRSVLVVSVDVSEQKRVEDRLRTVLGELEDRVAARTAELAESEQKYRMLAESTEDILFAVAADGSVRYIGPQVAHYGFASGALVGRPFLELLHPDDRARIAASFGESLARRQCAPAEFRIATPARGLRWMEQRGTATLDAAGAVQGFTGVLRDVTDRHLAGEALRASEATYRQLFELETDAIIFIDMAERRVMDVNDAALRLYGYSREEFLAVDVRTLTAEREATEEFAARLRAQGHAQASLRWHRRKDGARVPVEVQAALFTLRGRQVTFLAVRDVTERLAREQALRESEERYRSLFELETSGLVLADMHTGEIIDANPAALTLYGYTREEFLALNARDANPQPADAEEFITRLRRDGRADACPRWHRRKDGTLVPLDLKALRVTLHGREIMFAVVSDVSERLAREQALRESEEKYRRLFETETDIIVLADAETTRVLDANDAALRAYGYAREEFLALSLLDVSAEPEASRAVVAQVVRSGAGAAPLRWHRRKDGSMLPLEIRATRFSLNGRDVICGACRDISARLAQEEESRRQREALGRLAREVTAAAERERKRLATDLHDNLVQLLVSCQVRVDQLLQQARPRELRPTRIYEILDRAVRDTRDLTFRLAPPGVDGVGLAAALEHLCHEMSAEHGIPFEFRDTGGDVPLTPDARQTLFRCAREMVVNAARHAAAHRVQVTVESPEDGIRLVVEDDGKGFDAARAGFGFSAAGGYGLFSAREQLLHAGGSLAIHSRPGKGTRAVIDLPLVTPERRP